ncbi:DUF1949 domain-containing protein [Gilliamella apicola]|uniref:DUF1949 domain-containing protein n=1 Tax=Gilliamella sp. wkB108 TaxID=3120256 RepID=UPI00114799AB
MENRLKELNALIVNQDFDAQGVNVCIAITQNKSLLLQKTIADITRGRVIIELSLFKPCTVKKFQVSYTF